MTSLLLAATAAAQQPRVDDADEVVAELQRELVHARFSRIRPAVDELLRRDELTARQRNLALEVLAVTQIALGGDGADQTLRTLHARDPGHRLTSPDLGPAVQAAFARAREEAVEPVEVRLGPARVEADVGGGSPFLIVAIEAGADAVHEVALVVGDAAGGLTRLVMQRNGQDVLRTRLPVASESQLAYWLEAQAPSGALLARSGSAAEPLTAELPERARQAEQPLSLAVAPDGAADQAPPASGLLGQWWFWTAVGVVVGGGVAGYVLFGPPSAGPDAGSLGQGALR